MSAVRAIGGSLILVPNTLDLGAPQAPPIDAVLPAGVLRHAARLAYWIAEDAKTTRAFLKRVNAAVPLARPLQSIDIRELPRPPKGQRTTTAAIDLGPLLAPALTGADIGLISEAGLPGVADPGAALVAKAHQLGIAVLPLAGPSSLMLALAASGLNGQSFAFVGYLPTDAAERTARLHVLQQHSRRERQTQIAIETPYRNAVLMAALLEDLHPQTQLAVACGLTLPAGWCLTRSVAQWRAEPPAFADKHLPAVFMWLAA
ncbi:MAG: SAM-dependent methyltransferase [Burkholderiaceae bacterium]|nr:SAM-dependent methyltransferase [Burkholderiaceae bacterium]